jgi:uncharacterized protein YdeI (BOF family)
MKKIIIAIISAMILIPTMADAQIAVHKKQSVETLMNLRGGWVSLTKYGTAYSLIMRSDNQFDDVYVIILGKDRRTAIESLEALVDVAASIKVGETIDFSDSYKTYYVSRGTFKGEVWFKSSGQAGYGKTSKKELERLLDHLCFNE